MVLFNDVCGLYGKTLQGLHGLSKVQVNKNSFKGDKDEKATDSHANANGLDNNP
jgi:hypothetical protein